MIDSICIKCQAQLNKPPTQQEQVEKSHPKISMGFLYQLAQNLQFAFQSISLLIDFVHSRQAHDLLIKILKTNQSAMNQFTEQSYDECVVQIKFNGKCLSKQEISYLANGYYSKISNAMELVLSIFGIGKTGLFVNNVNGEKSVVLFSVDDRINPNYYREEASLYFIENNTTKAIKSLNGALMRKIITQGLRIYHPHPEKITHCQQNTMKVVILHPKIFVTNTKIMVYEIRQSNLGYDIDTHYNCQKIQFLNKLGYEISIHSEFRLSCYLSYLYLNHSLCIKIGQSQQPIYKTTYSDYLKTLLQNGALTKIKEAKLAAVLTVELYRTTEKYVMQNNGILMYWKGRLINRFETEFGRMLQQKFYKKKYRSPPENIWLILGIIEVDDKQIHPNLLKNKFKNTLQHRKLIKDIQSIIDSFYKKKMISEKQQDHQAYQFPRKIVKKIKNQDIYIQ